MPQSTPQGTVTTMRDFVRNILPLCAVILMGGGVAWAATDGFRAFTEESARRLEVAENPPVIPPLALEDMHGLALTMGRSPDGGKLTLVEFIYTTCPTICQSAGSEYAQLRNRLRQAGLADRVRLLSVSFDPVQDTPARMREYGDNHDADGKVWTVARIDAQDLDRMKQSFGLRVIRDDMGGYQHNAAIHLLDQAGRLTAIFDTDDVAGVFNAVRDRL